MMKRKRADPRKLGFGVLNDDGSCGSRKEEERTTKILKRKDKEAENKYVIN